WEIIFVDDASPDGTADVVRSLARDDKRVRLISRHNRRGLASAVVEGALAASAEIVAVMDGDLQHDESVLPGMYQIVADGEADVVSASRFLTEDGADGLSSQTRVAISNNGIRLSNAVFKLDMTDPLTGFFVVRRDVVRRALPDLSELGFKVLMDIIISAEPRPRVKEVPFKFRERQHGESKLDNRVMYEFFLFFIEKKISSVLPLPARLLSFAFINAIGIGVHLAIFLPLTLLVGMGFGLGQLIATMVAMAFNYTMNNLVTYSDRQLKGAKFYVGFIVFAALCSLGVIANVGVATALHDDYPQIIAAVPAVAGALITVVWNYVATSAFVWGRVKWPAVFLRRRREAAEV
ncbi:MAG: glycosyltransferase, partial [Pseudomonadota bacterium]